MFLERSHPRRSTCSSMERAACSSELMEPDRCRRDSGKAAPPDRMKSGWDDYFFGPVGSSNRQSSLWTRLRESRCKGESSVNFAPALGLPPRGGHLGQTGVTIERNERVGVTLVVRVTHGRGHPRRGPTVGLGRRGVPRQIILAMDFYEVRRLAGEALREWTLII